jgi:hypothetical protein
MSPDVIPFPQPITSSRVLAVEGQDDVEFFRAVLRTLGIAGCDIREVGGKSQFRDKLPSLKATTGFMAPDGTSRVTHLAIIRDHDADNAFDSIAGFVRRLGFDPPSRHGEFSPGRPAVGIFIMPGESVEGSMLEDLCLKSVECSDAMECVRVFEGCVTALTPPPGNISKAKAQAFLAAQADIVNAVGLGAQRGYWDLGAPCFDELREFLRALR